MTDLRSLGDRVVADPPAPPPDLDTLRRRRNRRRSRQGAAAGALVVVLTVAVAAVTLAVRDEAPHRVLTVPTTGHAPVDPPPPMGEVDVEIAGVPVPGAPTLLEVEYTNHTEEPVDVGCIEPRLDRWTGESWSPTGVGFTAQYGWGEPAGSCQPGVLPPGATEAVETIDTEDLEPGWYRWVDDRVDDSLRRDRREGRFTVGDAPVGLPGRTTVWLDVGEQLMEVRPEGAGDVQDVTGFQADGRLVLTWSSECNTPLAAVTLRPVGDRLVIEPYFGRFTVVDCVGEPARPWVSVIDIPDDFRRSVVELGEGGPRLGRRSAPDSEVLAEGAPHTWVPVAVRPTLGPQPVPKGPDLPLTWVADSCHADDARVELLVFDDVVVPMVRVPPPCAGPDGPEFAGGTFSISERAAALPLINQT